MPDIVSLSVGRLTFAFEPGWRVTKYDDWAFDMRRRVRAIDAHPVVAESSRMDKVRWKVT